MMPEPVLQLFVIPIIKMVVILGVLLLIVAYLTLMERKVQAYMQVRQGPNRVGPKGLLQPIADGLKLLVKEDLVPGTAQKFVFMAAPAMVFAPALLIFAVIPFGEPFTAFGVEITPFLADINIAILFILGISAVSVYGIILGGWSSNNKYSLMGGLRSGAQMVSYEVPMGFAVVAVLLLSGSLSLVEIVEVQQSSGQWFFFPWKWALGFPGLLALGLYFLCGVAETNRNPYDLPEAESELVGGFHTEYSGMKFALFFLGEYANMIVIASVATVLFFGGWLAPFPNLLAGFWELPIFTWIHPGIWNFGWFLLKMMSFIFIFMWFRATFPRYRFDQLMQVGWKWFLPLSLANVVLVSLGVLLLKG